MSEVIRRKVLLFDLDDGRREIRAANLRMRGLEVLCVTTLEELRDSWHARTFRLVLLDASDCPDIVGFSEQIRANDPRQRLAFFVGKPNYLAIMPVATDASPVVANHEVVPSADEVKWLSSRNGFTEASLRMQFARSSRRGASPVRPTRGPWDIAKGTPNAD